MSDLGSSPPEDPAPPQALGRRAFRGVLWAYGAYVGQRAVVLVVTALLARLLVPSEFGLVSIALLIISILEVLSDFGLSQAIVIVDEREALDRADSVFRWSLGIGTTLTLLVAAMGPLAARFFHEPALTGLLPVMGLTLLIRAVGGTHYGLAQKQLDFRSRTVAEIGDVAARGMVGIALAASGVGAWSLVLGHVAGSLVFTGALWTLVRWRPNLRRPTVPLGRLLRFGGTLMGLNLLAAVIANVDYMIVGRVLGTTALGLYTLGFKLPEALISNLSVVAGRVLFPAFAAGGDPRQLSWRLVTAWRFTWFLCLPMAAAMVLLAEDLVIVAFGRDWLGAVDAMRLLALYALATSLGTPAGTVYKATGRADVLVRLAVPRAIVGITAIAVVADRGILWVAGANAAVELVQTTVGLLVVPHLIGIRLGELARPLLPIVMATAASSAIILAVAMATDQPMLTLALAGVAGGVAYLGVLWLCGRDLLLHLWRLLRPTSSPAS